MNGSALLAEGMRVCLMPTKSSEHWDRYAYSVSPDCGLGWKPYTIRVTNHAIATWACHSVRELKRRLPQGYRVRIDYRTRYDLNGKRVSVAAGVIQRWPRESKLSPLPKGGQR